MKNKILLILPWIIFPLFDTVNQIFMKFLGLKLGDIPFGVEWISRAAASPYLWGAFGMDVGSFVVWMVILKRANLSFAVPFISIGYIMIMAASWLVFKEHVYIQQVISIACIISGLVLIGGDRIGKEHI